MTIVIHGWDWYILVFAAEVVQNMVWKDPVSPEGVNGGRAQDITEEQ